MKSKLLVAFLAAVALAGVWRMNVEAQTPAPAKAEMQALLNAGYELKAAGWSGSGSPQLFFQKGAVVYNCFFGGDCARWPTK